LNIKDEYHDTLQAPRQYQIVTDGWTERQRDTRPQDTLC